jgi:hypothetical protein
MSQHTITVGELLTRWGEAYRAAHPPLTPEQQAQRDAEILAHFFDRARTHLDDQNLSACRLCLTRRPRTRPDDPRYYAPDECVNVRKPWHHPLGWNPKENRRAERRHRRRVRKGRVAQTPALPAAEGTR